MPVQRSAVFWSLLVFEHDKEGCLWQHEDQSNLGTDAAHGRSAGEALKQHRSELEAAAAKWQHDSKNTASQFLQHVPMSIASGVSAELHKAGSAAVVQLEQALERHNKILARATITCALSAAVALVAAATFVWVSERAPHRPEMRREHVAFIAGETACN